MKAWRQPICRVCFAAFNLGAGRSAHIEPVRVLDSHEPCMVCSDDNEGIYVRVEPGLTEGLRFAQETGP